VGRCPDPPVPLWWFSMPAILKGWVDRVYSFGFAYGVGSTATRDGDRYGEGRLAGKRAMLLVTAGGWEEHYAGRGINGPIEDLLFPINHGILYYPGYDVCHLSWSTARIGLTRRALRRPPSACARGCGHSRQPRPSLTVDRTVATIWSRACSYAPTWANPARQASQFT
jgi:hypothetical protein